jgi:Lysozyme like domain
MAGLSIHEIFDAACAAGFTPEESATWTAIAMAESGGQPGALNSHGEYSQGLWQINVAPNVRANHWGNLYDPVVNARAAFEISNHGTDMRPRTTTHDANKGTPSDCRTYLSQVESAVGVMGDGQRTRAASRGSDATRL